MRYRDGYKYQVAGTGCTFSLGETFGLPGVSFDYLWARLDKGGTLFIAPGYAWDGPSGPTLDSAPSIWASLCHDALYQAMREGQLGTQFRYAADKQFYLHLRTAGMSWFRAKIYYWAVRKFGAKATLAISKRVVWEAP